MRIGCRLIAVVLVGCVLIGGGALPFIHADEASAEREGGASAPAPDAAARHFDAQIAPLLARHCLECHDSATKKGKLDLSRKDAALSGGKKGKAIVPGKAAESLLWEYVESDEMPEDRPPLSPEEKQVLREWIDAGAIWTADEIDPLAYTRDGRAAYNWVRRLTVPEYIETVRSAVGVDVEEEARRILPPDVRADGFSNTAYNLTADLGHVEAYARLASIIVRRMDVVAFASEHAKCKELNDACMREVIGGVGKWLLRGPLEEHEISAFLGLSRIVAKEGGDFAEAVSYIVEAMLQSPRFIYRIEQERGDGKPRRVGEYELASRLSYSLWGGPPDKELMRAADAGELADRSGVEAQVERMLQDPRAVERSARFFHEWLDLDRLDNLRPNADRFPNWDDGLASDMREETLAFFKEVAWEQKRPLADLMNAQVTFTTPRLAEHYGLAWDRAAGVSRDGLLALYRFDEGDGETIRDTSGAGDALNLKIESPSAVEWKKNGLEVKGSTLIATAGPPKRLIEAVKKSKAITLEAWITPADTRQSGPARILTLSADASRRNFTMGQDGDRYEVRFRAKGTDGNGLPGVAGASGLVTKRMTHIAYTRDAAGNAKLYINGDETGAGDVGGDLSNWDGGFRLAIANELTKDRAWRGTFHRVAIYGRALTAEEVRSKGRGMSRYDLAAVPGRGGLLTQGSVLTVGGDEASMVSRGLFILHDFLYSAVGNPPPCADTTPVPTKPGLTQRAVAEGRIANQSCGGCHSKFEPLAFGLEKFDGLGSYHELDEHGNRLRDDGEIVLPGSEQPVSYGSAAELMDLLAESERVRKNITRKATQFALGRPLVESDARVIDEIHRAAQKGGGTYASLIKAIVMSDLVQMTQTETGQEK